MSDLYHVRMPYYTCGFEAERGVIMRAAPIMSWAVGKKVEFFEKWVRGKKGEVILLSLRDDTPHTLDRVNTQPFPRNNV